MTTQFTPPVEPTPDEPQYDPALTEFTDKRSGFLIIAGFFIALTLLGLIEFVRHFYPHG
jgi:hypothetical protein